MENIIAAVVILAIVVLAARHIIKAKKNGQKCIGCPDSGCCSKKNDHSGSGSCCGGCNKG